MRVAALFRYPVKGFTGEACPSLEVLPGGRIAGDRVLGLRFNASTTADDVWSTKVEFAALVNTPALASLRVEFDHETQRLRVHQAGEVLLDDVLDAAGRGRFAAAIERFLSNSGERRDASRDDRFPLRVVGDGVTPRYQDREPGYVTLHGRRSVDAVATAVGEAPAVTERRFRSNVALEGSGLWEEQRWIGRTLRIGDVEFKAESPVARCLATHAHPVTGERDLPIMKTLLTLLPTQRPTFAILLTSSRGGRIRVDDPVEVCG